MEPQNGTELVFCRNASESSTSEAFVIDADEIYNFILAGIYLLFILIGLPSNLLVMVAIVKEKLYTQPTIIVLLNLVVTDLLVILLILPFATVTGLTGEFMFGNSDTIRCEVCRANLIAETTLFYSSLFTITLLAFDRFLFIYMPLRYDRQMTARKAVLAIAVSWLLSILLSVIPLIVVKNVVFSPEVLLCKWDGSRHGNIGIISALGLLIPYFFGLICNIWVIVIAVKNIRSVYKVQKAPKSTLERNTARKVFDDHVRKTRNKKQLHLTRVFAGIISSNTIAWLPFIVLAFLELSSVPTEPQLEFTVAANVLFSVQVIIHPILETTLINDVRTPLKKLVTCRKRNCGSVANTSPPANVKSSSHDPTSEFKSQEAEEEGRVCCCCCHGEKCKKFCWCRYLEIFDAAILPWNHADHTPPADMTDHTPSNNKQISHDIDITAM